MIKKFQRETATNEADLPHEFQLHKEAMQAMRAEVCRVCDMKPGDPRHKAWEQEQLADRERAQLGIQREIGS